MKDLFACRSVSVEHVSKYRVLFVSLVWKIDEVGQKHTVGFVRNAVHRAVEERRHGQQAEHPDNDQESLFSGQEKKIWKKQMFR